MYVLLLVLFLMAALAVVVFFEPVRISFYLDTDELDMRARFRWIPFMKIDARFVAYRLNIAVLFFEKRVYSRTLQKSGKKKPRIRLLKALALSDTRVKIACGTSDPFHTGVLCAAAGIAGALIKATDIELVPDFVPDSEYLKIRAATKLNLGKTLTNLAKA